MSVTHGPFFTHVFILERVWECLASVQPGQMFGSGSESLASELTSFHASTRTGLLVFLVCSKMKEMHKQPMDIRMDVYVFFPVRLHFV